MTAFGPVTVEADGPVTTVRCADEQHGNTFRREWLHGLVAAVDAAVADSAARVVVIAGLPEVFCAGATKETLCGTGEELSLPEYVGFVRILATCPLPVVAEMQGHAFGGGLVLGLYADTAVLSERSLYAANFMQYGIAPYFGATHIVPAKLGEALGTEMLLTARGYRGRELKERGCGLPVVPHAEVPAAARGLARTIAAAPRAGLEQLKRQFTERCLTVSDAAMARELHPHLISRDQAGSATLADATYGLLRRVQS